MASMADLIQEYIESLLEEGNGFVELRRAFVAQRFRCAPSQVSYVIESRFSPERGYLRESRRGGGGFIRLQRVAIDPSDVREIVEEIGNHLSQAESYRYLDRLHEEAHLDERTYVIMRAALSRNTLSFALPERDRLRAGLFKTMLNAYFSVERKDEWEQ